MAKLVWKSPELPTKDVWECYASADDREYWIREPNLNLAARTVEHVYEISVTAAARFGIASENLGEAATLKEAIAIAQRHAEAD
jgi:hypothetical protein